MFVALYFVMSSFKNFSSRWFFFSFEEISSTLAKFMANLVLATRIAGNIISKNFCFFSATGKLFIDTADVYTYGTTNESVMGTISDADLMCLFMILTFSFDILIISSEL